MTWRFLTTIIGMVLACVVLVGPLATTSFAAKRHDQSHYGKVSVPRHASRFFRCKGGRYYTYGGGWGCDYYRYSRNYPFGRR